MVDVVEEVLTDEEEEKAYLAAFVAESETPSAEHETEPAGVAEEVEDSPDDKTPEPDGEKPSDKGTASGEKDGQEDDPYAWINELPEGLQAQAKALQHSAVSDAGRVAALTRRVNEADARYAAAQQSKERAPAPSAPAKQEDKELSPKLKEFVESYPELAASVQEMVNQERTDIESLINERLQPINEETQYRKIAEAKSRLEEGASKIFDTPTSKIHYTDVLASDLYKDTFLKSQPLEFQQMANSTTDPDTALWVLQQFHTFAEQYAKENGLMDETSEGTGADKTSARRKASKKTAGTPRSRSAVTDPDENVNYDTLFRNFAKKGA